MWLGEGLLVGQPGSPPCSLGPGEFWGRVGLVACCLLQGGSVPVVQGGRTGCSWPAGTGSLEPPGPGPLWVWWGSRPILKSTGYFSLSLLSPQMAFSHW